MKILSTGIPGLDKLLGGGIPERFVVGVIGSYGTGKTTLGLHFIHEGVRRGEKGIVISFDEDEESIFETAESFGMKLPEDKVQVVRLEAEDVKRSFEKVEEEVSEIFASFGAKRVLIDTISVLETLYDDAGRYKALSMFRKVIKSSGATAIITSESDRNNPIHSKFGILEYVADGLIVLKMVRKSELEEAILTIEVLKMRRMPHLRVPRPYVITESGMEVFEEAEIV